jgi:hypothetical protein
MYDGLVVAAGNYYATAYFWGTLAGAIIAAGIAVFWFDV